MANNDILELFEMVGTVAVDVAKSIQDLNFLERKGKETADSLQSKFEKAFQAIEKMSIEPDITVNSNQALRDVHEFKKVFSSMLDDLQANAQVDFDTDPAVRELQQLLKQAESLERSFSGAEGSVEIDGAAARQTLLEMNQRASALRTTLSDQRYAVNIETGQAETALQQLLDMIDRAGHSLERLSERFGNLHLTQTLDTIVNHVIRTTYDNVGADGMMGPQYTPSGSAQSNGPPGGEGTGAAGAYASAGLGAAGTAGYQAARRMNLFGYDLNQAQKALESYHRRMMQYAMQLNPQNVLQRATMRLDFSNQMFPYFQDSKNMIQLQASLSAIESGITNARSQLSQLGFGRTKAEIKALEGQMHSMANIRLDNLKDQIKLTEKALSDMKKSANAHEFVEEMAQMEEALAKYKKELAESNPVDVIAKANGYKADNLFGKDVIYKPFSNALDKLGGRIVQFANKDLAYLQNKTYESLDNAAKAIIGPQTTKAEEKAKMAQLMTKYQTFGTMLSTTVTPAVVALAAAFGMVAANAEKGWGKFEAQTLKSTKDMKDFKNIIADTSADTGSSIEEVGELFSVLHNQMGRTKENIKESAEWGLNFKKAWGTDAVEAISAVDEISKELGVTQKEATDILALAMKKHQGDLQAATKDVMKNEKAWKKNSKTRIDGMTAYEKMVSGLDDNGIAKSEVALRKMGNSLLELWKALEPTVIKVADAISKAADNVTEFLRNNPGMAKFIAHFGAFTILVLGLVGPLSAVAGFLLMNRNLFQALGQALGFAGKGMVAMSPAARMLYDNLMLTRNAMAGLPRMFRSFIPMILSFLRGLPGMVGGFIVQFVKMNPILTGIAAVSWVIYKNWERFEPVLKRIWDSLKRIGNSIIEAFAGPGKTGAEGFGILMDKLAKIAGDVLLPAFEALATILEVVASVMEGGGGKFVAYALAASFVLSVVGKLIPSLGSVGKLFGLVGGKAKKGGTLVKGFGLAFSGLPGVISKAGPSVAKAAKGIFKFLPRLFTGIGGTIARFGAMLIPLLSNPFVLLGAAIVAALAGVGYLIYKGWDKIEAFFKGIDWSGIGKGIIEGLIKGLEFIFNWSPVGLIWNYLVKPIMELLEINSPSKLFMRFGQWLIEGLASGIEAGFDLLTGIFDPLISIFSGAFENITSIFSNPESFSGMTDVAPKNTVQKKSNLDGGEGEGNGAASSIGVLGSAIGLVIPLLDGLGGKFDEVMGVVGASQLIFDQTRGILQQYPGVMNRVASATDKVKGSMGKAKDKASSLGTTVKSVASRVLKSIPKLFSGIGGLVARLGPMLISLLTNPFVLAGAAIVAAIVGIGYLIYKNWDSIRSGTVKALKRLGSAIQSGIKTIGSGFKSAGRIIGGALSSVNRVVTRNLSKIRRSFSAASSFIRRVTSKAFNSITRTISNTMNKAARVVSSSWSKIRRIFVAGANFIYRKVVNSFRLIWQIIFKRMKQTANFIASIWSRIKRIFSSSLQAIWRWVSTTFTKIYNKIKRTLTNAYIFIKNIFGKIGRFFTGLAKKAWGWGANIVDGIVGGLKDKAGDAISAIKKLGNDIADAFQKVMQIFSPSRRMRKISKWVPIGAALGIDDGKDDVAEATRNMADTIEEEFNPNPDDFTPSVGGTLFYDTKVNGDPLDSMRQVMSTSLQPAYDISPVFRGGDARTTIDKSNKAQITKIDKVEVHVKKLQSDQDFEGMKQQLQNIATDLFFTRATQME
ncbi:hypothetical protein [Bacillus sp. Hm123]|uniref:hypothetical protein n=1 Tax=Bacillus sp. Hm123 TaxID=3450745 RepID=UPI003F4341A4